MAAATRVGVLQFFSWPDRRVPLETVYARAFDRIAIMDEAGYDAVWLAEHHFSSFSVCPSIHLMGMHVASRTKNLRIGTGVSLAPFYDPLRLAEEVALLDVLSGGRVNWGVGRGYQAGEFAAFGVPADQSYAIFREHLEVVLQAWTQEKLDYKGEHVEYHGIEVLPKPLQKPHPPVWLAASSPEAISWAGEQGHSILLDPHSSHQQIAAKQAYYRESLERGGHSYQGRTSPVARLIAVAKTQREAEAVARAGAAWTVGSHRKPGLQAVPAASEKNRERADISMERVFDPSGPQDPIERYMDGVILYGTPDSLVDEIGELRETMDLDYLLCAPFSHESFLLFTDEVLPRLA